VQGGNLNAFVQDRALAGRKKALQALCVGSTIAVRDE